MSRSNPALTNPSTRFFDWKGGEGTLGFYDKEKEARITVPLPFEFLVLDELATITGYSKADESGFWSNEVRSTVKEELTVHTKKGTKYIGFYKNDQGIVQMPKGAGYAKSIYIAYKTKTGYEIGNIKAGGSALGAWIEFGNSHIVGNGKVVMAKGEKQTSPVGDFYAPVFEYVHATPEEDAEAIKLDKELQIYLSQYLAAAQFNRSNEEAEQALPPLDETDFEKLGMPPADTAVMPKDTKDAVRKWDNLGKGSRQEEQDDAEAESLYKSGAALEVDGEAIDPADIPF